MKKLFDLDSKIVRGQRNARYIPAPTRNASTLRRRFKQLGNMRGLTAQQIEDVVGRPNARSRLPGGGWLYQWSAVSPSGAYAVGLRFDSALQFVELSHEQSH